MTPFRRPAAWLVAVGLLLPALSARAAEADKYLPPDTEFVLVVNLKQIRAWPPFQEKLRAQLDKLLQGQEIKRVIEDTGIDPRKNIDRVVVVQATSSSSFKKVGKRTSIASGPSFLLLEGQFDREKLLARAEKAARETPERVKLHKVGKAKLAEIQTGPNRSLFTAFLDDHTLMVSSIKGQAEEALERAAGKNKTVLKSKQVADMLAKAASKQAVWWVADGDMVTGMSVSETSDNGKTTTTTKKFTLKKEGIEQFHGGITLGKADFEVRMTVRAQDKAKAEELAGKWEKERQKSLVPMQAMADKDKQMQPLVDAVKAAHIATKGDSIHVQARATPEAVIGLIRAYFFLVSSRPPAKGPGPAPDPVPTKKG